MKKNAMTLPANLQANSSHYPLFFGTGTQVEQILLHDALIHKWIDTLCLLKSYFITQSASWICMDSPMGKLMVSKHDPPWFGKHYHTKYNSLLRCSKNKQCMFKRRCTKHLLEANLRQLLLVI